MLTIPIRDLQQRGTKAITRGATGPTLVTGRPGALFFVVPADPSRLAEQEIELSRAMARADLRSWQTRAVAAGLDRTTDAEIESEIAVVRRERRARGKARRPAHT
ncbi:MAG TPA: prevent-host-death protein [Planctomycetes bacterium]|nr:prevent-host-death protein [Planctomycetota bacterium]